MAEITKCDSRTVLIQKNRLSQIYKVIKAYRWIIEAYVSDFYVKDHWSRLPQSWQEFLEQVDFSALSCLLTGQPWCSANTGGRVSPLSLLALKAFIEQYALNRRCVDLDDACVSATVSQTLLYKEDVRASADITPTDPLPPDVTYTGTDKTSMLGFKNGQLMEMEHIFRKHVKPKKQHEIRQLGKVVQLVTGASGSDHVVDVGAGLGHLSRLLTFAHGLKVTTVEAAGGHAPKASEFDRELKKDIQKKLKRREPGSDQQETTTTYATPADLPNHVVCRVEPDISTQDFLALVLCKGHSSVSSGGEMAGVPSGSATTQTVLKSGGDEATSMECEHSTQTKTVLGIGDTAASSLSSSAQSIPTPSADRVPSDSVRLRDASQESFSAESVHSEETVAKISRYEFQTCLKCGGGKEGISAMNKTWDADLSCSHSRMLDNGNNQNEQNSKKVQSAESEREEPNCSTESVCDQCDQTAPHAQRASTSVCDKRNQPVCDTNQPFCDTQIVRKVCDKCHEPDVEQKARNVFGECDQSVHAHSSAVSQNESSGGEGEGGRRRGLVLAGLHACGDLTATLLRVFVNCPAVSALVSVGCCYMKLSAYSEADDEAQCERGYPMSQFVRSFPSHSLTYEAREMACHFADAYAQRLLDNPPHLKIHSYRAALQYVVTRTRPDFVPGATRLIVKKGAEIPFPEYASQGLRRLGMDVSEVPDDVMATAESMTVHWRRVVAFYTLRLSLAPLVETALLLDRMLFLYEQGIPSVAVPVFDSALSPRNFALLACKPQTSL